MKQELTVKKSSNFENYDYASVYVHSSFIHGFIKSHHDRPIVKITHNNKSIYRKLRAKGFEGLDKSSVIIDHISMLELSVIEGNNLTIKKATFFNRYFSYFIKHPIEEIRIAWYFFIISIGISIISLFK